MVTRLAILADTHMPGGPRGSRRLPPACVDAIAAADLVLHAGDFSQIFNPGSPTDRRRSPRPSFGIGEVRGRGQGETVRFRHAGTEAS